MNNLRSRKFMAALSLLATSGLFAVTGYSADPAPVTTTTTTTTTTTPPAKDSTVEMEKFQVTGSYLSPAANTVAIPVITVDAKAIANSGSATSVLDILRKTVPQFQGNNNIGAQNANVGSGSTNGGSQLSLRNAATLVLINGRRVAYAPVDAKGGFQFVDVNLIPVAAIDRIEVLADGASAIYGTDAVSGVVNIILKTDYEGFETGGRYGWSTDKGNAAERSAYIVGGTGNGKTNITVSAEWVKVDPVWNFERTYSDPTYGTPTFAGSVNSGSNYYYLDPSLTAPPVTPGGLPAATLIANGTYSGPRAAGDQFQFFNLARYVTQTTGNQREAFSMAFDHKVSDSLKAFGDFMYVHTNTFSQINGQPITASIAAGVHGNPFNATVTARNRIVTNPRQYLADTTSARAVFGLEGKITEDWSWESAADYNRVDQDYANPGVINQAHLTAAINGDRFNMFSRSHDPAELAADAIVGTAQGNFISKLSNYDFKVRGKLFDLPAGSVDVAVGGEVRQESLAATADPLSQIDPITGALGWNGATTLYPFDAGRTVTSEFAEVRVPILKDVTGAHLLEVSGAVRHENYSDTTDPTVPKFTLRYLPIDDQFAIRGTYSKSFSAPQLYSLFGPVSIGFTTPFTLTKFGGGTVNNVQTNSENGSNPNLEPSTSKNWTAGVVYSPKALKGFSVSVDYWNIKQDKLVSTIGATTILQDVELNGTSSQYASKVHVNSFTGPGVTGPGQISGGVLDNIYVVDQLVNLSAVDLDGFDVKLEYVYNADSIGRFDFVSNVSIYDKYTVTFLPGDEPFNTVALATATNGTLPRWQTYTSVEYTRGNYTAFAGVRYLPGVTDYNSGNHIGSFYTLDLLASYTFGTEIPYLSGARVSLGVNNVFNRFGPSDPATFTDSNMDTGTYGSLGRFVYVDLKYKF
jgi:iron complex outermembrane receptor protein